MTALGHQREGAGVLAAPISTDETVSKMPIANVFHVVD